MKSLMIVLLLALPLCAEDLANSVATVEVSANAAAAAGGLETRSYRLKHKDIDRAAAVVKDAVSSEGSISLQPSSRTIVITDQPANVRAIVQLLERFDVPPQMFTFEIRMIAASINNQPGPVPEELKRISELLAASVKFNTFEALGELSASGKEGDSSIGSTKGVYRADFSFGEFDPSSETLQVKDLRISRVGPVNASGSAEITQLLKTTVNLRLGRTVALGASREPGSKRSLLVVMVARKAK